jgi:putative flippase GtrA
MFGLPSTALQWLSAGLVLLIVGVLIKFRGWTFLLAGYDETSPVPDEVVADVAGNTILRIGLAAIVLGVLIVITNVPSYLPTAFGGIIVLAVVRMIYRLRTYSPANMT